MKGLIYLVVIFAIVFFTTGSSVFAQQTKEETIMPEEATEQLPTEEMEPEPAEGQEVVPAEPQVAPLPTEAEETVWIDDAVPSDATTAGTWKWDTAIKFSGTSSHTNEAQEGVQEHSFKSQTPVSLPTNSAIVQYVYLDPATPPKGIMLKLYLANGEELGTYWEGEEEVFAGVVNYETTWYMDVLPQPGRWIRLEVIAEELGIEGESLVGMSFITADGKAYWDKTSISQGRSISEEILQEETPAYPKE